LPARADDGTTVFHSFDAGSNSVVAMVVDDENVTEALGTSSAYCSPPATKSIVEPSHRTLKSAGCGP